MLRQHTGHPRARRRLGQERDPADRGAARPGAEGAARRAGELRGRADGREGPQVSADALAELYGFGQQIPEPARARFDELIATLANDARARLEGEYQAAHWQLANTAPDPP